MTGNYCKALATASIMICSVLGFTSCDKHSWEGDTVRLFEEHGHGAQEEHDAASHESHAEGAEKTEHAKPEEKKGEH